MGGFYADINYCFHRFAGSPLYDKNCFKQRTKPSSVQLRLFIMFINQQLHGTGEENRLMIGRFSKLGVYRELFRGKDILRVIIGGLLALAGFIINQYQAAFSVIGDVLIIVSVGINGLPIIWEAVIGLVKKQINVDELVSIAIVACLISGDYLSAAVVSFVMVAGSLIEEATGESARRVIQTLVEISPKDAIVLINGREEIKPISDIRIGDLLLVKPGDRIPVDGTVISGITFVDESAITGEPMPVKKISGDTVYAGTVNNTGAVHITADKVGEDSTLGKVIQLVSEAEAHHPESVALIDRYAAWFTPTILLCAAIAWVWTGEVSRAITVLIVGCPCALILAAPTAVVAAISRAAKSGILVKGGQYLEIVAAARTVFFDKTGTLTEGNPRVEKIIPADGYHPMFVLKQAACVEQNSTHPLAKAVLKAAHEEKLDFLPADNVTAKSGLGVTGCHEGCTISVGHVDMGNGLGSFPDGLKKQFFEMKEKGMTPIVVYQDDIPIGIICVSDHIRDRAGETIHQLK